MINGDRDDLLWLAGLLEGEGAFDLSKGRYPRVRVAMTDRDTVGRAATLMGTSVRLSLKQAPSAPTWHSEVSGPRAESIMRELLPHMGTRRSQRIAEVLAAAEYRRDDKGRKSIPGPVVGRPAGIMEAV
jgi:hypothetical protein